MKIILKSAFLELSRSYQHPNRRFWLLMYTFLIQLYVGYSIFTGQRLANFETEAVLIETISRLILFTYIYTLPAFILIISFESFVQEPQLPLMIVASRRRYDVLLGKSLSILLTVYLIYIFNSLVSFIIFATFFQDQIIVEFYLKASVTFLLVISFYVFNLVAIILTVRNFSQDTTSAMFIPVIAYYVIPFLISNSLSFGVLNDVILRFSPTIWVVNLTNLIVFSSHFNTEVWIFIVMYVASFVSVLPLFNRLEIS